MAERLTLDDLAARVRARNTPGLELLGVDPIVYVIYAIDGAAREPLVDKRGKSLQFRSRGAALDALRKCGVTAVDFVHRSSYGEMVGLDDANGSNELRERLIIPAD
ncbi:MAG: DUF6482 family protein [Pseudomonadota bacterium]